MIRSMPKLTSTGMAGNSTAPVGFCPGCGYHLAATGRHRDDCTKPKETGQ